MAPQLDAAQHVLIETLLKEGFETKLIASEASCSVRAVQRIRRKRQLFEMPILRTNRVGRRSCITSPMRNRQSMPASDLDATEVRRIKEERLSTEKCLQICAQLSEHISQIQITAQRSASTGVSIT
jgi:hypothetical protein